MRANRFSHCSSSCERLRRHLRRGELGDECLELCPHEERLAKIVARQRAHADTAVRLERDEAERREAAQRLAHRRAGDAEAVGQLLLAQHRARLELAGDDRLLDQDGDVVGLGALEAHGSRSYAVDGQEVLATAVVSATSAKTSFACLGGLDPGDLVAHAGLVEAARLHPRPDLGAGDLGRRRVLHQVVDRRGPTPCSHAST